MGTFCQVDDCGQPSYSNSVEFEPPELCVKHYRAALAAGKQRSGKYEAVAD